MFVKRKTSVLPNPLPHIHDVFEILLVLCDGMRCQINDSLIDVPKNSLLIFNNMDVHLLSSQLPGACERYVVHFNPDFISLFSTEATNLLECFYFRPLNQKNPNLIALTEEQTQQCLSVLTELETVSARAPADSYGGDIEVKLLLAKFLLLVNRAYRGLFIGERSFSTFEGSGAIYNMMKYIQRHYAEELTLDLLAKEFYISKNQLCSTFKKATNMTPHQYILSCRLRAAQKLLIQNVPVETVCYKIGFSNVSHFSRIFKNYVGVSPKKYQLIYRSR